MYFDWIGDPIVVDIEDKQLTTKPKTYYKLETSELPLFSLSCNPQLNIFQDMQLSRNRIHYWRSRTDSKFRSR